MLANVNVPINFTIYGPKEVPSYWSTCEELIAALPDNIKVDIYGPVDPFSVRTMLAKHDLFLLPTKGENYGHVIYEALSVGLPVLISDQTPWKDLRENNVGWECPLDSLSAFANKIEQVSDWGQIEQAGITKRAIEYSKNRTGAAKALEQNRALFTGAIKG